MDPPSWLVRLAKAETTTGVDMPQGAVRSHRGARWGGNRYPPVGIRIRLLDISFPPRLPPSFRQRVRGAAGGRALYTITALRFVPYVQVSELSRPA